MKKLIKTIGKSSLTHNVLCVLIRGYMRLVYYTSKKVHIRHDIPQAYWRENKPFILSFWHGELLMMPFCWQRKVPISMLISKHKDGQIIAKTVKPFGIDAIQGSAAKNGKDKGGSAALRQMVKSLKKGVSIGITPDGPRGPRKHVQEGVVVLSQLAKTDIIPVSVCSTRSRFLSTWDRFLIAKPFGKIVFVWGQPLSGKHFDNRSDFSKKLEMNLLELSRESAHLCEQSPIEAE